VGGVRWEVDFSLLAGVVKLLMLLCPAIFENVIENIMNINVVMILYVIGIIICDLIYHLKELYVIYASEIIVRSIVYIVCKTVITVVEWFCSPTY
jgi:hypothetical protein